MYRYAVVTGANKGIGLEIVKQLASLGIVVVLTARNETRGRDAMIKLHQIGLSNVVFHQLDVLDALSIQSLTEFIRQKFGRLDILINNAGASCVEVDKEGLKALNVDPATWLSGEVDNTLFQAVIAQTYEKAEECLNTNYYGVKRVTKALLPLLQLSSAKARIVNLSSLRGELKRIPNGRLRKELGAVEELSEEKIDTILKKFLDDFKGNVLEANGWGMMLPAYSISKASLNAYTRVLARNNPHMLINCVHPGFVSTDLNWHKGTMTVDEGARGPIMLALLPDEGPTGCYFECTELAEF
ncbi:salutaridine reductase-like [Vicia villosa]|uniref:salutaridine reductase-like n=1 Tax=Vicia villosa TaxID=3911 RepID=UPI00273CA3A5|nr:salutaridine reductase-like [Vicia villosa]